jgi:hypothetical protein
MKRNGCDQQSPSTPGRQKRRVSSTLHYASRGTSMCLKLRKRRHWSHITCILPAAGQGNTFTSPSLSPENNNASPLSPIGVRCKQVNESKSDPSSHKPLVSHDTALVQVDHSWSRAMTSWLILLQSGRVHKSNSPALEHERMRDESVLKSMERSHDVCMGHVAMRLMRPWLKNSPIGTEYLRRRG